MGSNLGKPALYRFINSCMDKIISHVSEYYKKAFATRNAVNIAERFLKCLDVIHLAMSACDSLSFT